MGIALTHENRLVCDLKIEMGFGFYIGHLQLMKTQSKVHGQVVERKLATLKLTIRFEDALVATQINSCFALVAKQFVGMEPNQN